MGVKSKSELESSSSQGIKSSTGFGIFFDSYTGLLGRPNDPFLTEGRALFRMGPRSTPLYTTGGGRLAGLASQTAYRSKRKMDVMRNSEVNHRRVLLEFHGDSAILSPWQQNIYSILRVTDYCERKKKFRDISATFH